MEAKEILKLAKNLCNEMNYEFNMACVLIHNKSLIPTIIKFIDLCKKSRNDTTKQIKTVSHLKDFKY